MDADEKSPVRCARPVNTMNDRAVSRSEAPTSQPSPLQIQNRTVMLREGTPQEHTQQAPLSTIIFYDESGASGGVFLIPRKREKGIQHIMTAPARKVDTLIKPPQTVP
jgi:hypothetical protein